jgi:trk system potassium uptake protein TrkA
MYAIVAGGGKVGASVARSLLKMGHEVTLIEQRPYRYDQLEEEFEHQVLLGDATELHVLERAGIGRPPDIVLAVTGDDEDNLIICQLASEGYKVPKVVARVNDPRNQEHFDLLGIAQTVCATANVLGLVEHEVPEHGIVHLLELRKENLEIVELQIDKNSPVAGKRVGGLRLPDGSRLISVMRAGRSELAEDTTVIRPGDQVLAVLEPGKEDELRELLLGRV